MPGTTVVEVSNSSQALRFFPMNITAAAGEQVFFLWKDTNEYSVIQSDFNTPCQPKVGGFNSGVLGPANATAFAEPNFGIIINDTKPIYYFSGEARHCEEGMVGSINGPAVLDYQAQAMSIGIAALSSISSIPSSAAATIITASMNATAASTSSSSSSTLHSEASSNSSSSSTPLSLIAGIVLGTSAILLLAVGLWIFWKRTNLKTEKPGLDDLKSTSITSANDMQEYFQVTPRHELITVERPSELPSKEALSPRIYELSEKP
ncbi:hypothetical protein B0J14DRAFT_290333 [Halenospora varia]|nr:hypothetical protein B0J14DRAFT_290333 [Halenospora varia]